MCTQHKSKQKHFQAKNIQLEMSQFHIYKNETNIGAKT